MQIFNFRKIFSINTNFLLSNNIFKDIFNKGDKGDKLYIILKGSVSV